MKKLIILNHNRFRAKRFPKSVVAKCWKNQFQQDFWAKGFRKSPLGKCTTCPELASGKPILVKYKSVALLALFCLLIFSCKKEVAQKDYLFFVGSYTSGQANGKGITTCSINTETGEMKLLHVFENSVDPSYLAVHPNGQYLYAVNETGGEKPGYVSAYKILENSQLEFINEKYTRGDHPCHLSVSADEKNILVANYSGGSVTIFLIMEDGSLGNLSSTVRHSGKGAFEERQERPHAHYFAPAINDSAAFVVDLGTDKIYHYLIKKNGRLGIKTATATAPGTGPRHLVFHPHLNVCYVILEFTNEIEAYKYTSENEPFERFQTISTLIDKLPFYTAKSSAIKIHPSGQFLFAANRNIPNAEEDNLAMYSIRQESGELIFLGNISSSGKMPRDFEIGPEGKILIAANQSSSNLVSFKINNETGKLSPTGFELNVNSATCIKFLSRAKKVDNF